MSDNPPPYMPPPPPPPPTPPPPEVRAGMAEAAIKIGTTFVQVLPPAFVALAAVNVVFLGGLLWFLNSENVMRNDLLKQVSRDQAYACGRTP